MKPGCAIIRFDEIGIKAEHTRGEFVSLIAKQLKKLLPGSRLKISAYRIVIFSENAVKSARLACKVFGVSSASPAVMLEREIGAIKKAAKSFYKKGRKFRVSCQRSDKDFPLNSQEVCRAVGEYIYNRGGKVDLTNYDINIGIDFFLKKCFVYSEKFPGFGGLPVSSQGKILCLMNNEDDYLACLMMMNRGCLPIVVGREKLYKKLAKHFPYLKIRYFDKVKYGDFLGAVSGNGLSKPVTGFECPVFYPLAFIGNSLAMEKFKSVNN